MKRLLLAALFLASPALAATGQRVGVNPHADVSQTKVTSTGGTTARALKDRFADVVNVKDYGAKGDGATDDTAAIQAAVRVAGLAFQSYNWFDAANPTAGPLRVVFPDGTYKMVGTVHVPQGVIVDFGNATIAGSGYTVGDNVLFDTGYFDGTSLVTNIGTANESHRVVYTKFVGGRFTNCKIAFNLFNFNEGSAVEGGSFYNCRQNITAARSWYARFHGLMSRGSAGGATDPAFAFDQFVNVQEIESVFVQGRVLAFQFSGGVNGLSLRNLSAEGGTNGIKFTGEVNPLNIDSCYFETLTGVAIDISDASAHRNVTIDNNWFKDVATGIVGAQMTGGRIGSGNRFDSGVTTKVSVTDSTVSTITVEVPAQGYVTNGTPTLPSGYSLGSKVRTVFPVHTFNSGTGLPTTKTLFTGGLIELPFVGNGGHVVGGVPYATHASTGGTSFSVNLDTLIGWDAYNAGVFSVTVTDNIGAYTFNGRFYGTAVFLDGTSHGSKTLTVSNNGGVTRLVLGVFSHPSGTYGIEGVVRLQ